MPYGTVALDTLQSSTTGTPTVFKDGAGAEIGTLCRAWVNFNGTGTVAIRASFNVSSITDNGTGNYTVNFTTAMPDINYALVAGISPNYAGAFAASPALFADATTEVAPTTSAARLTIANTGGAAFDAKYVCVSVFR